MGNPPEKTVALRLAAATGWIGACEFVRNELVLGRVWRAHYRELGLEFPAALGNNLLWGLWSTLFAVFIAIIRRAFGVWETLGIAWGAGFVLMWVVTGNLAVLPLSILPIAIPWSLLETFGAVLILGGRR